MGPPPACQVRCARCHEILTVAAGITEFSCPKCQLPQMLPPELINAGPTPKRSNHSNSNPNPNPHPPPPAPAMLPPAPPSAAHPPAQGIDPTKIQLPCARCKAILNVPHGLARFNCPQCGVDLAVDLSKIQQIFGPGPGSVSSGSAGPPQEAPEEVNEVRVGWFWMN